MPSDSDTSKSFKLNFFKNLKKSSRSRRYLICHNCYGYYPLKENELPDDFAECECGNDLEFYENIDDLAKINSMKDSNVNTPEMLHDDYEELQEITNVLKSKSKKRKKFFEELSTRIEMQEEILNDIKYGEWKLWDTIEENSIYNNNGQHVVGNIMEQEDNFLSCVREQRSKANVKNKPYTSYFVKIGVLLVMLIIVMEIFFLVAK